MKKQFAIKPVIFATWCSYFVGCTTFSSSSGNTHSASIRLPLSSASVATKATGLITFQGYGCGESRTRETQFATCTANSALCGPRHSNARTEEDLLTKIENRPYEYNVHPSKTSRSDSSLNSTFSRWCSLAVAKDATGCAASSIEYQPVPLPYTEKSTSGELDAVPVLGFVVAKGGRMVERGLLSIDFPVRKLVVVQMGNDPGVTEALKRVKARKGFESLRIISGLANLGCAAGWNRVILEDLNAAYWMILGFDISFPPGVLLRIHRESTDILRQHPRIGLIHFWYQWGGYKSEWSAFILRREVVHDIGFFDENVWPMNTEDYEYSVRMNGNYLHEPWYRHLLPTKSGGCPVFYVEHGVASNGDSGFNHIIDVSRKGESNSCKEDAMTFLEWQHRRSSIAYVSNKWGIAPGSKGGEVRGRQNCQDPDKKYGRQPEEGRKRPFFKHPTGADYFPPVVMTSVFRDPYGHSHLPVWFWIVDPGIRRCIITGKVHTSYIGSPESSNSRMTRRLMFKNASLSFIDEEPCIGMRPAIPYNFDMLSGLPARCVDALDLCTSSLTSLQNASFLEKALLVPPLVSNPPPCDKRKGAIPLPSKIQSLPGPCPPPPRHQRASGPQKKRKRPAKLGM